MVVGKAFPDKPRSMTCPKIMRTPVKNDIIRLIDEGTRLRPINFASTSICCTL
jgi:hypothetical protein